MATGNSNHKPAAGKGGDPRHHPYKAYVIVLFVIGILALNYPLLSLYDHVLLLWGVPLLYLYLFMAWLGIIGLTALVMERTSKQRSEPPTRR